MNQQQIYEIRNHRVDDDIFLKYEQKWFHSPYPAQLIISWFYRFIGLEDKKTIFLCKLNLT